ncbi:sulfite oxidase [Alkalilacustris brevis]|uniref:sulfite oxidase n=1 Tax=Alkalilacustris brevis TaxID=2026338 RepID=UPI000E0CFCA8|nr:sulfite oxidase [Alkalilacustris brevis]
MRKIERGLVELYNEDPERADELVFGRKAGPGRRGFLKGAGLASMGAVLGTTIPFSSNMPAGLIPAALAETVDAFRFEAKHPDMIVHNDRPVNVEAAAHLLDDDVTPADKHFIRNNGTMPDPIDKAAWRLKIDGEVENEMELSYDQLMNDFEHVTLRLQIECGGNGRAGFNPLPRGNPWSVGAIGNAEWTGVRLSDLLRAAGLKQSAVYTGHFSYDEHLSGDPDRPSISRGGPIDKMMDPHTIVALKMNGEDIPIEHGFPVRMITPGWAGSASQKWLTRVWVRDREHDGPGMTGLSYRVPRYPVEAGAEVPHEDMMVMGSMIVKSVITFPEAGAQVAAGRAFEVRGQAWAGDNHVTKMETSIDFGATWQQAELHAAPNRYSWQRWRAQITPPQAGYYEVWARATDDQGRGQPVVVPGWNPRGYLNNSCHRIHFTAV